MATPQENDQQCGVSTSPESSVKWHIVKKGFQAGSFVGIAAVIPALVLVKKVREPATLLSAVGYSASIGAAASGVLASLRICPVPHRDQGGSCTNPLYRPPAKDLGQAGEAGTAGSLTRIDEAGYQDRAARLGRNETQQRADAFSSVGAAVGLAAAAVLLTRGGGGSSVSGGVIPRLSYGMALAGGSAAGAAAGVAAHVATRPGHVCTLW